MTAFGMIGLAPHDFAHPYTAFDEDGDEAEYCGVRTPQGSPCGYPRSMHRGVTLLRSSLDACGECPKGHCDRCDDCIWLEQFSRPSPDPLRAPGTDDYILGLYAPDRPRSAAAGIIIAAAVVVIVGAFLVLAFAVFG